MPADALSAVLSFRRGSGARVGAERIALIEAVGKLGSIRAAAAACGLSYKAAWDAVQALNNLFAAPLVTAQAGGRQGGAASLTPTGRAVISAFHRLDMELAAVAARLETHLQDAELDALVWSLGMRTSARNALRGVVTRIHNGAVSAEVVLEIAEGVEITSVITRESVAELGLAPGRPAIALIKSSFILLATGEGVATSARNQLAGRVAARHDGEVMSEITIEIAHGKTLSATITRESAERLQLRPGAPVTALIKAPHVILAVE